MISALFLCLTLLSMLLAWRNPRTALLFVILCLPLYTLRGTFMGIPVTALETLLCGASIVVIARNLRTLNQTALHKHMAAFIVIGSWIFLSTLSMLMAQDIVVAAGLWKAYCIEPVLFAIALFLTFRTQKEWRSVCVALLCVGSIVGLASIIQYLTGFGIPEPWQAFPVRRATAHYGYPNAVGLFLAPIGAISLGLIAHKSTTILRAHKLAAWWTFLCCLIGCILAQADGALIALMSVAALLLVVRKKYIIFAVLTLTAVLTVLLVPRVRDAVTFHDTSGQVRVALWTGTLNLIEHHPIAGSTLGQFPYAYEHYRLPSHVELLQYPHNLFLDFWVELGILGLIWIVGVLLYAIVTLVRMRAHAHIQSTTTAAAFYLCALLVYGIVDVTYFKNDLSVLFWIMLTLIYSTAYTNTKRVHIH